MNQILILTEQLYEDLELWYPKLRLTEEGYTVVTAAPEIKTYQGKYGYPITPDQKITDINPDDYTALIIPGGFAPDRLRRYPQVLNLVQKFHTDHKPIAFICHAGWVPISAQILKGKHATSVPAIKDDMINAGCLWEDSPVIIDQNLISSRKPEDLPKFCQAIIKTLKN